MYYSSLLPATLSLLCGSSSALVARANLPPSFSVQEIGQTNDSAYPSVYRDGGGGALINGHRLIVFSDTSTLNAAGGLVGFTSNSVAYCDASDPTSLTDFGSNGVPELGIPFTQNETDYTNANWNSGGSRIAIWPGSNITPLSDGVTGVAVYDVASITHTGAGTNLYSTMVTYTPSDTGPAAVRTVSQLAFPGSFHYGTFGSTISRNGYLILFAHENIASDYYGGLLVARVHQKEYDDPSQWTYWNGQDWTATPPAPGTADSRTAAVLSGAPLSSGDVLFSEYLNTWIFIFFDEYVDSKFWVRYSTTGKITGEWSDAVLLYQTTPFSSEVYDYAGHAYSMFDPSGQTVLLSWTYNGGTTKMATVTFD